MVAPKITVSENGHELEVTAGKSGTAHVLFGPTFFVGQVLSESGRDETAEWIGDEAVGDVAWLTRINVETGKRGAGVGTAMLRRCLRELEKRGVDLVFLHAMPDYGYESQLDDWYVAHGFGSAGEVDGFPLYYARLGSTDDDD